MARGGNRRAGRRRDRSHGHPALVVLAFTRYRGDRADGWRAVSFYRRTGSIRYRPRCSAGCSDGPLALIGVAAAARSLGAEQRQFAQSALGKYLPRDVAKAILRDPERILLTGEKREIYVIFTDLEGFTALSHELKPEVVATLINRYLNALSEIVLAYGGTLDKFVGDAIVAFWGAPLSSDDDDGPRAPARGRSRFTRRERRFAPRPPMACRRSVSTRVGLHRGEAIVGNFGGEGRMQYTCVRRCDETPRPGWRTPTRALRSGVLVSAAAIGDASAEPLRFLGRVMLRGRSQTLDVYEALSGFDLAACRAFNEDIARFDAGDAHRIGGDRQPRRPTSRRRGAKESCRTAERLWAGRLQRRRLNVDSPLSAGHRRRRRTGVRQRGLADHSEGRPEIGMRKLRVVHHLSLGAGQCVAGSRSAPEFGEQARNQPGGGPASRRSSG